MAKIEEMKKWMHVVVEALRKRASIYHYKLTGDDPECLSRLLELDEAGVHHLLFKCGLLSDETSKKYKKSGVVDQHNMFAPCGILSFSIFTYSEEKKCSIGKKEYYLTIGKVMDTEIKLHLPRNQYGTKASPNLLDKQKIHVLEIIPPTIQLNKDEKDAVEKLKVLVFQSMPMTVRRNQCNQSGKKPQ
jgi:hypothetical protein